MKYFKIAFFLVALGALGGCKKWLDVNTDPATPQIAKAEFYLAPIISQMAVNSASDGLIIAKYTQGLLSQDVIEASRSFERHGYFPASDLGGNLWRMIYINHGVNLEAMISDAEKNGKWTYAGIGYAIKAWGYQMLTDSHGPVILDEAFKDQLTFKYQDQPEVYAKVREWCDKALIAFKTPDVANLSAALTGPSGDHIYKGDREKWKKFVYGLLAQQYSHLINKADFQSKFADSVVKYVDLSFGNGPSGVPTAADDATVFFNGSGIPFANYNSIGDSNPLSQGYGAVAPAMISTTSSYGRIGQPIVDYLTGGLRGTPTVDPKASSDPRLTRMINPMVTTVAATNGVYRGIMPTIGDVATTKTIPSALGSVTGTATAPYPGKYIFANSARYPLMSYAQLQFTKAEALFIKGDLTGAYAAYINGIKGHMEFINTYGRNGAVVAPAITPAEVSAYLLTTEVAPNASGLRISDIMGQKYIAQWGWANMEQWTDLRKYHYSSGLDGVFRQFKPLEAAQFHPDNLGANYAYRLRPRYSSEYVWNKNELAKWGGLKASYHTDKTWVFLP